MAKGSEARERARRAGKKYYRSGTPCKNRHQSLRRTDNGACVECERMRERLVTTTIKQKKKTIERNYGLSQEQVQLMLDAQDGKCVCGLQFGFERHNYFSVDHDHATGEVRGLLCSSCNLALGNARDNPNTLLALINYLKKYQRL